MVVGSSLCVSLNRKSERRVTCILDYEPREPERDFDARDHQKTRDQRSSDYKTRGDGGGAGGGGGGEYSVSSSLYKKGCQILRVRLFIGIA